jgi:hypothetical protein
VLSTVLTVGILIEDVENVLGVVDWIDDNFESIFSDDIGTIVLDDMISILLLAVLSVEDSIEDCSYKVNDELLNSSILVSDEGTFNVLAVV